MISVSAPPTAKEAAWSGPPFVLPFPLNEEAPLMLRSREHYAAKEGQLNVGLGRKPLDECSNLPK